MASTNQSMEYRLAERKYFFARTDEERLTALGEMLRLSPKHKSSEQMRANIKSRIARLKSKIAEQKKKKTSGKEGIKKADMQAVIIGMPNSGKSSLLSILTNASPNISEIPFATKYPELGTMIYENVRIQLVDMPPILSEYFDIGIVNNTDLLLIVIQEINELSNIIQNLEKATKNRIIIFNKSDLFSEEEKRKIQAYLQSKKYNFVIVSCKDSENTNELRRKIFNSFDIIRIYTKEPHKKQSQEPMILKKGSSVKDAAEKIRKGFSLFVKETRIWGPSSKFPAQKVGMSHILADKDIIEFHTR